MIIQEVFFFVKDFKKIFSKIILMSIGTIILELRKERNLSQAVLAKAIGVSQKAIDYWERGVNEPKATYIIRLADFFGISADVLLGRKE